jgi:hypothetical protein
MLAALFGWLEREPREVTEFLREENRVLKAQLRGRRLRLTDDQRRRLAVRGHQVARRTLRHIATVVTPDTILRWHRELVAQKWTRNRRRTGRPGVQREIRSLVLRMAADNPAWGYTRLQGAFEMWDTAWRGPRSPRFSTRRRATGSRAVAHVAGVPEGALAGCGWRRFLHHQVWTARGLVTYYTLFTIELASRRVHVIGSTPYPNEPFMLQASRRLTTAEGALGPGAVFICDRDRKVEQCGPRVDPVSRSACRPDTGAGAELQRP